MDFSKKKSKKQKSFAQFLFTTSMLIFFKIYGKKVFFDRFC